MNYYSYLWVLNDKKMTTEQRNEIIKLQAVLTKVSVKQPVFFNVSIYRDTLKVIKKHGERTEFVGGQRRIVTNWVLTEKGKQIMNVQL